jgi:hypothetical protein
MTKSTVFVHITQPYVDMSAARAADMLLPTDDMPFGLEPTPIPEMDDSQPLPVVQQKTESTGAAPAPQVGDGQSILSPAEPILQNGEGFGPAPMGYSPGVAAPTDIGSVGSDGRASELRQQAKARAEKSEKRIWDWLVEGQWHKEVRQVIEDAARIGTGVLKGPFPVNRKMKVLNRLEDGSCELRMTAEIRPASKCISCRNLFPDPACGDSIHSGSYIWERDTITAKQLVDLKGIAGPDGAPEYIGSQIDAILKEGPGKNFVEDPASQHEMPGSERFEIWHIVTRSYYHQSRIGQFLFDNSKSAYQILNRFIFLDAAQI